MKYKVGDKVRVKSLDWYNENKNSFGNIQYSDSRVFFESKMSKFCGSIVTIKDIDIDLGAYKVEENTMLWIDDMLEENVEEISLKGKFGLWENKINGILFSNENYADKVELCLGDDYEIVVEDGRTFVQKKKPKYPKNYEECCDVLKIPKDERYIDIDVPLSYNDLLYKFTELLICRNAYWKIAGEQMDKPWEPIWDYNQPDKYLLLNVKNSIHKDFRSLESAIFAFPTEEMLDAFYENFKDLIEKCKELL